MAVTWAVATWVRTHVPVEDRAAANLNLQVVASKSKTKTHTYMNFDCNHSWHSLYEEFDFKDGDKDVNEGVDYTSESSGGNSPAS